LPENKKNKAKGKKRSIPEKDPKVVRVWRLGGNLFLGGRCEYRQILKRKGRRGGGKLWKVVTGEQKKRTLGLSPYRSALPVLQLGMERRSARKRLWELSRRGTAQKWRVADTRHVSRRGGNKVKKKKKRNRGELNKE